MPMGLPPSHGGLYSYTRISGGYQRSLTCRIDELMDRKDRKCLSPRPSTGYAPPQGHNRLTIYPRGRGDIFRHSVEGIKEV
jgi:hypothetical protein